MTSAMNYQFTLNNYTQAQLEHLLTVKCRYIGFGKELAPTTGTPHLQGLVMWTGGKTTSACVAALGVGPLHVEVAISSYDLYVYNKKDEEYFEAGRPPISKKRQGEQGAEYWEEILALCKQGKISECPPKLQVMSMKNLDYIYKKELLSRKLPAFTDMDCRWYWGDTGSGKSRSAREEFPDAYLKMCNKWWDGYDDEETVLIEDFDQAHSVLCHHLKLWSDCYPFIGEVKQASRKIRPKRVIITSNWSPEDIWQALPDLEPILRRFKVTKFSKLKMPPKLKHSGRMTPMFNTQAIECPTPDNSDEEYHTCEEGEEETEYIQ